MRLKSNKVVRPCPASKMHHVRIPISALTLALPLLVQPSYIGLPESMLWIAPGALWLGLEIGYLVARYRYQDSTGWHAAIEAACLLVDRQRQEVVDNDQDPSWTEHFLAIQQELRSLECAEVSDSARHQAQVSLLSVEVRNLRSRLEQLGATNMTLVTQFRKIRKSHSNRGLENGRDRANMDSQ